MKRQKGVWELCWMAQRHRCEEVKDRGVDVLLSERVYGFVFAVARVSIHDFPRGVCGHHGTVDLYRVGTVAHSPSRRDEVSTAHPWRGRSAGTGPGPWQEGLPDHGRHPDHLGGRGFAFALGASDQPTLPDVPGHPDLARRCGLPRRLGEGAVEEVLRHARQDEIPL